MAWLMVVHQVVRPNTRSLHWWVLWRSLSYNHTRSMILKHYFRSFCGLVGRTVVATVVALLFMALMLWLGVQMLAHYTGVNF